MRRADHGELFPVRLRVSVASGANLEAPRVPRVGAVFLRGGCLHLVVAGLLPVILAVAGLSQVITGPLSSIQPGGANVPCTTGQLFLCSADPACIPDRHLYACVQDVAAGPSRWELVGPPVPVPDSPPRLLLPLASFPCPMQSDSGYAAGFCADSAGFWTLFPAGRTLNLPPDAPNRALNRPATQSSLYPGYPTTPHDAGRAVDGVTDGNFYAGHVAHTDMQASPWWQVALVDPSAPAVSISRVVVWNRTDCCGSRLADYTVSASLDGVNWLPVSHQTYAPNPATTINASMLIACRWVRVQLTGTNYLALAEVQVF